MALFLKADLNFNWHAPDFCNVLEKSYEQFYTPKNQHQVEETENKNILIIFL